MTDIISSFERPEPGMDLANPESITTDFDVSRVKGYLQTYGVFLGRDYLRKTAGVKNLEVREPEGYFSDGPRGEDHGGDFVQTGWRTKQLNDHYVWAEAGTLLSLLDCAEKEGIPLN